MCSLLIQGVEVLLHEGAVSVRVQYDSTTSDGVSVLVWFVAFTRVVEESPLMES